MTSNRYTLNTYIKPGLKLGSKVRKISIDSYFQKLQREKKKKRCVEAIHDQKVQGAWEACGIK